MSYNITYNPDPHEHFEDSYIQLGRVAVDVRVNASWVDTLDWDNWNSPVSFSFFR